MTTHKFSDWKRVIFRCSREIKGLCGGVVLYAAQISPADWHSHGGKGPFPDDN